MQTTEENTAERKGSAAIFQSRITLIFLLLTAGLEGLMALYWTAVLEPQLTAKAEVTARALANSYRYAVVDALDIAIKGEAAVTQIVKEIDNALSRILLLKDPDSGSPFILGVEIESDYSVVKVPEGRLDLKKGLAGDKSFVSEMPLYSKNSKELMGIARFHNNPDFFRNFKADVRKTFFAGAGICLVILILAWGIVTVLFAKIKEAEKKLQAKQAQIVHAGRLTAMGEMATGIAHEINQPLAIMRIAADGLNTYFSRQGIQGMEAKAAQKIVEQVKRAAAIIDNMRSFARAGSDVSEAVNLAEPVNRALSFFKEQFRIHQIALMVSADENLPRVKMNPQKFEQIVVNFLSNARYAVEKKGESAGADYRKTVAISLFYESEHQEIVFEVEDNGIGMNPEVRERCMEPFYTTKGVGEGTGLGLSIAHGIAREFKMDIQAESAEGKGSTFRLRIKTET